MKITSNTPMADQASSSSSPSIDNPSQTRLVDFSPLDLQRLQDQHTLSLFAKVLGRRVRVDVFTSHIRNVFNPNGSIEVTTLSSNFFLIMFSDPSDYENALQNGPWTINYYYIALIPWTPNFKPSETSIKNTKVWIRLYDLPVEYYDPGALLKIAEKIAPLVKIDPVTESRLKCRFARLCVDLDLLRPLIDSVTLPNGFTQRIRYEGGLANYRCWGCRLFGHVHRDCPESTSIATQEVRRSWFSPRVLDSPGESITPPGDVVPDSLPATPGSGFGGRNLSRVNFPGGSRIPPGDAAPGSPVAVAGSGFAALTISRVNFPGESRIPPGDAAPDSHAAVAGSGFDDLNISRVNFPEQLRIPRRTAVPDSPVATAGLGSNDSDISRVNFPGTATPDSPVPDAGTGTRLLELQTSDQEVTFVEVGNTPNVVVDSQAEENQELMTPGSIMRRQAILRGVQEQEMLHDPVEIQEMSNEGRPRVLEINPQVSSFAMAVLAYSSGNRYKYQKSIKPLEIDHTPAAATLDRNYVLSFNCRGASDPGVIRALKDMVKKYRFSVVVLTETKTNGIEAGMVIAELGFSGIFVIEPVENSGGIWLLWNENRINVEVRAHDQHYLYAVAQVRVPGENLGEGWIDVGVFGVDDA